MSTPRRVIKLTLSPRDAANSPDILKNVEDAFKEDDIEIYVEGNDGSELTPVDPEESKEALDATADALDAKDAFTKQGMEPVPSPQEAKNRVRQWLATVLKGGVRVAAEAVIREAVKKVMDSFF